jgi:hypothetical protein
MGQLGFFDAEKRLAALSAKGRSARSRRSTGALGELARRLEAVVLTPDEMRRSSAGRKRSMRL